MGTNQLRAQVLVEAAWSAAIDAMLRVLGKYSLSGMAIAATARTAPKVDFRELYLLEYSRQIRAAVSLPLAYLGGVKSLENVRTVLGEGFDAVAMARALLREPELVNQWREQPEQPSLCDNCNSCVAYIYHPGGTWCIHRPPNRLEDNRVLASAS